MTNAPIAPIARGALTFQLFAHLREDLGASNILIGRGIAPPKGGWTGGQPGSPGQFINYAVLKTGRAVTPAPNEPERVGRDRTSWQLTYLITYHSTLESNVDLVADVGRASIVMFGANGPLTLNDVEWTVQKAEVPRLGDTRRDDSTDPPHWTVTDDVSLHLSRVRTR